MEPYYNYDNKIIIYHGDMFEIIPGLGMRFASCITDPPYGVQRNNGFKSMGRIGCTFGDWDKKDVVVSMLPQWINCICNVVDGNFVMFNDWHNMGMISECMNSNGFEEKELVVWRKTNPMPRNVDRRFVPCMEYALWSVKNNAKWTFNKSVFVSYEIPVIECARHIKQDDFNDHPTSKPLELMNKLVSLFTNENDWILDPFGGSGTIAVSCYRLNRKIVLIEKDEHYCEIMAKRVENETKNIMLF